MSTNKDLPFPMEEFEARYKRVREKLADQNLDGLILTSPENIYYVSGYGNRGYYVFQALVVSTNDEPFLVIRKFEIPNVERLSWVERVVTYEDTVSPIEVLANSIANFSSSRARFGLELSSWFLPAGTYLRLKELLPEIELADGSGVVESLRVTKSELELAYIQQAADAVSKGMHSAIDAIEEGKTENAIAGELYKGAINAGSEFMAGQPYVASGPRSGLPHATWQGRRIENEDIIFVESSANVRRYSAALVRTSFLGSPPPEVERGAEASISGLERAIEAIRPGVTSGEVDSACRGEIEKYGLGDKFRHRTGYSVGVGFSPAWGEGQIMDLKPGDRRTLKAGMVFHLVPVIFPSPSVGVGFSETVAVTEDGVDILTSFPRRLEIK